MRKSNSQKGITLIALIITIIVLLILAVVAITAVTGTGIIQHAKNAKADYEQAVAEENATLDSYLATIEENVPGGSEKETGSSSKWTQEGTTLTRTNADGTTTQVKIGDYVDYDEGTTGTHTPDTSKGVGTSKTGGSDTTGYTLATNELTAEDLKWRVLGVNKDGELELISATPTIQTLYLANDEGYLNAEDNLNNFCNDLYGKGQYATKARSLNVDDIDKLTNYDKTTYSGYGNKWTYRYPTTEEVSGTRYMQYRTDKPDGTEVTDWTNITSSSSQTFRKPEETTALSSTNPGSRELTYSSYGYNIVDNLTTEDGYTSDEATEILKMLLGDFEYDKYDECYYCDYYYWLASCYVNCYSSRAYFCVRRVYSVGSVSGDRLFDSCEYFSYYSNRVRPVVSLSSDVNVTTNDNANSVDNMWTLSK